MVKIQKPNPKSIKKNDPIKKSAKIKQPKVLSSKESVEMFQENIKKIEKNVKKVDNSLGNPETIKKRVLCKNRTKITKAKNDTSNKNCKEIQKNAIKIVEKIDISLENDAATKCVHDVKSKKEPKTAQKENKKSTVPKHKNKKQFVGQEIQKKKLKQNTNLQTKEQSGTEFEPANFDENKLKETLSLENIKKVCQALQILVEKEVSEKKTSIFSDYRYFLNVSCYKIANCPKRMVKLNLKHSLVDIELDDVVMIVPDLKRGAKADFEPTIQHYLDILREQGQENIKIVPFNELRKEYTSYEAKSKFAKNYDFFLCDGRIVSHAVGFLGKPFQKPRTTIHAVHLDNPKNFKNQIEHALKRTSYRQLQKGDMVSIPIGNHRFNINQLAENAHLVIDQLKTIFAGGYPNIRHIYLKIDIKGTSSLPLYINLDNAPAKVPNVVGPREQRMIKLKKQANDILSNFSLTKTGDFVKLNKTQLQRKQQIREAREALLSKDKTEVDENDSKVQQPLKKKVKTDKQFVDKSNADDSGSEDFSDDYNEEKSDVSDEE